MRNRLLIGLGGPVSPMSMSSCACHTGNRGAQLVCRVRNELLLRLHRAAQHGEQAIQRHELPARFREAPKFSTIGAQIEGRTRCDFSSRSFLTGRSPSWDADPHQYQRDIQLDEVPEKRAHEAKARDGFGSRPCIGPR